MPNTRILVVNDDKGVLLVTSHILLNAGYEVLTASSGQECLDLILLDKKPQLILLDVVMPDIDGFEVCSRIKADPDFSGILVILYSSNRAGSDDQVQGLARGADGYIVYPCPHEVLLARIEAFARIQKSEQRLRESEERFRLIAGTIQDVFWMTTPDLREVLYVSPAFESIWGRSQEQLYKNPALVIEAVHPEDRKRFMELPEKSGEGNWECEFRIVWPDGTIRWLHTKGYHSCNADGTQRSLTGITSDITKRKQAEEALRISEERYRDFFENALMGTFQALPEGRFLSVNPAMAQMLGYDSPQEMVSSITDIATQVYVDPDKRAQGHLAALKGGWVQAENLFRRKDGTMMTAHHAFRAILNQDGTIAYLEGFIEDLTRRKEAEKEQQTTIGLLHLINSSDSTEKLIRQIAEFLKRQFDCDSVGIRLPQGDDFPYFETIGFPEGFVEAESSLHATNKEGRRSCSVAGKPLLECLCGAVICGHSDPSKPFFTEHGSFWTDSFSELLEDQNAIADIEHVRGRCPASGYESMALVPLQLGDNKLGLLQLCDRRKHSFGLRTISLIERVADKIAIALARLTAEAALQEAHCALERRVEERTVELVKANDRLNREIEERKRAAEQLYHSKIMLQTVFDGIQEPLVMIGREGKVRMINRAARDHYRLTQYSDAIGKLCFEALRGRPGPCPGCERPLSELRGFTGSFERKSPMDRKRLERVTVYQTIGELTGEEVSIIRISDITHAKLIEKQLIQNEKLASLGLLISGIAHEINNPNSFISFNIPILRDYLTLLMPIIDNHAGEHPDFEPFGMPYDEFRNDIFKLVENMEHGSVRINNTVSGLKEFVRKREKVERRPVDLKQVVDKAVVLCRPEINKYIKSFSVNVSAAIPSILTDSEALEQIIINLLINASHAADKEDSWVKLEIIPPGTHSHSCIIEVSDNGYGMNEATKLKIFDPFFTTKGPRKGTGLGLYICQNLVEGLGGRIEVESEPGKGSTFRIILCDQA
jgi:PAS domain S-box-containing protein